LELAATIGKQLLDKGQLLETKIQELEEELEKASDMVNQLRHEINLKDDLLQSFIELDNENFNLSTIIEEPENVSSPRVKTSYSHNDDYAM
jgi:hypothetical protein